MSSAAGPIAETPADREMYSKIGWRLMPLLMAAYVVAFLDRINVGYAQLQMKQLYVLAGLILLVAVRPATVAAARPLSEPEAA